MRRKKDASTKSPIVRSPAAGSARCRLRLHSVLHAASETNPPATPLKSCSGGRIEGGCENSVEACIGIKSIALGINGTVRMIAETALSQHITEKAASEAASGLVRLIESSFPRKKLAEFKFIMEKGLPTYLRGQAYRCERIKTLLSRNDPVLLSECYISPNFELRKDCLSSEQFLDKIASESHAVIISGLAGSGKSAFLRYAFSRVIERGDTYYPIFFELRRLNAKTPKKGLLLEGILESIQEFCPGFTLHLLKFGLSRGSFYLLLDGYDEVNPEIRSNLADEIESLAAAQQDCRFLLTSRPSNDFDSWSTFDYARLQPFSLEQAVDYVTKLPYDPEQKESFTKDLSEHLYEQNRAFLSNPLLTAMMLFTYSSYGEIPTKRHVFYEKCFDVLSREHDSLKGRYNRVLFSGLSLEVVEKIFMMVCVLSYRKRKYRFSEKEILSFISNAQKASSTSAVDENLIRDYCEAISIMVKDGLEYEFIHRSFQEYFYAKFVVEDRKLKIEDKVNWLLNEHADDDTIEMIIEMDTAYFEEEFLLPNAKALLKSLDGVDPSRSPSTVLGKAFKLLGVRQYVGATEGEEQESETLMLTISDNRNFFIMNQAISPRYRADTDCGRDEFWPPVEQRQKVVDGLKAQPEGMVKIHHTNNNKLIELGFGDVAVRRMNGLRNLVKVLGDRRAARSDVMLEAFDANYLT